MSKTKILFGTHNRNKAREVQALLGDAYEVITCADLENIAEVDETGETLEANARLKAETYAKLTGLLCFADDTGLEVEALNGQPGVRSARFAGEPQDAKKNIVRLLKEMENKDYRRARFRTVISLAAPTGKIRAFEGVLNGAIARHETGTNGFGYDPVFVPDGSVFSLAEISTEEKNAISHRGVAVRQLIQYLIEKS